MENSLDVASLQEWFEASKNATVDARKEGERARDYINGIQLTAEERAALQKRGQPPVVINRVRRKVEFLLGLEVRQRTDPKAFPRTPQHEQEAEGATDAIRFVADNEDWDTKRTAVYDNMLGEGFGGVEVLHKQNGRGETEVVINHYPWDRLFYDPHSRKMDFSDARYRGVVLWQDETDFIAENPKMQNVVSQLYKDTGTDTYDDRPPDVWVDAKRKRVRVILMWYRKGSEWHWCKFIKGQKLDGGPSPYTDEDGASICPLILQSAYVDRNNARYGIVRDMFDPQDEVNKRRSKALHQSTSRQTVGIKGAVDSVAGMKRELSKPDGHVEIDSVVMEEAARVGMKPFEVLQNGDQTAAHLSLLQEAKNEIDMLGANSALAGETGESASGRAVLARQQGGMVEIAHLLDKLHHFTREVYRHIWMRIRQFWNEERWVRVTDDERNVKFVGINRPVTLQEKLGEMDQEQVQQIALQMGLVPNDPRLGQVVEIANDVAKMDVDILIEEVPDQVTLQGEAFEALLRYAQAGTIPPTVLIEADPTLPTKKKDKLLEMLQDVQPTPSEQLELADKEAEVAFKSARAEKTQAEAARLVTGF